MKASATSERNGVNPSSADRRARPVAKPAVGLDPVAATAIGGTPVGGPGDRSPEPGDAAPKASVAKPGPGDAPPERVRAPAKTAAPAAGAAKPGAKVAAAAVAATPHGSAADPRAARGIDAAELLADRPDQDVLAAAAPEPGPVEAVAPVEAFAPDMLPAAADDAAPARDGRAATAKAAEAKPQDVKTPDVKTAELRTPEPRTGESRPMNGMPGMRPALAVRACAAQENFVEGDYVVYPTHGVGKVEKIAIEDIAGHRLELIHITFEENRMTLRVPVAKARTAGLRKLATQAKFDEALAVLRGRARIKRTMWSRRAQEYEAKINSGDPIAIAEVVRDLHRNSGQPDQSFSERQIYESAMDRLAAELAALNSTDKTTAAAKLVNFLKSA